MKEFIYALKMLLLFKPYTIIPRWLEYGFSILAWMSLIVMSCGIYKIIQGT